MASETHICTACGYEGKPVKPPKDEDGGGDGEVSKSLARIANLILPGAGLIIKPLAMVVSLPIYLLLWPFKRARDKAKHCSNCGLPLMVRLSSDAGFVAKRKQELKAGKRFDRPETPVVGFGREVILPGDTEEELPPAPRPEKLPGLEEMLTEKPPAPIAAPQPVEAPVKPIKKPDPESW